MTDIKFRNDVTVELVQHCGSDAMIANAARVSTGADTREHTDERDKGLIKYLMRERHGSPFEHNLFTFRIEAPLFVSKEHMRHRSGWSYNETSGRYRELEPVFYEPSSVRPLVQTGKPGAYTFTSGDWSHKSAVQDSTFESYDIAWREYQNMLQYGVAKEVARTVLPVGIYTHYYASCNARSLMHFLGLRTSEDALHEIRQVAHKMEERFRDVMPTVWNAWIESDRRAP